VSDPIILSSGYAAPEGFPGPELGDIARDILRSRAAIALQYGHRDGYMPLRTLVAEWLTADGDPATADEVTIVTGAKQTLDITARAFGREGDLLLASEPTYMNGLTIFKRTGLSSLPVPNDEHGVDVDVAEDLIAARAGRGEPLPKLIYEITDFQNPTGTVLSEARREKLVAIATRYSIPVLEDNPYRWVRFDGRPALPLKHFDKSGMVVSTGTFAKILGPGMRLGWVHAKRDVLTKIMAYKADAGSSPLTQMIAHEFFKANGSLDRHLERLRSVLRPKRDAMLRALERHLGSRATWTSPEGGYYVWATLPGVNTDDLAPSAHAAGVDYYRGSLFYTEEPRHDQMRLSFSYETPERIEAGVATIAAALAPLARAEARV
jgi:2-aminoadipate transaminase